ncbi:MAG: hypothetical protein IKF83_02510 [Clostridia bacterium]|nr:hypothetical protein [Clostridia bacterium]
MTTEEKLKRTKESLSIYAETIIILAIFFCIFFSCICFFYSQDNPEEKAIFFLCLAILIICLVRWHNQSTIIEKLKKQEKILQQLQKEIKEKDK